VNDSRPIPLGTPRGTARRTPSLGGRWPVEFRNDMTGGAHPDRRAPLGNTAKSNSVFRTVACSAFPVPGEARDRSGQKSLTLRPPRRDPRAELGPIHTGEHDHRAVTPESRNAPASAASRCPSLAGAPGNALGPGAAARRSALATMGIEPKPRSQPAT
jgi:hypothetical protein